MTEPFELRRRTPAGQLRYLAEQVAKTNGLDRYDRVRLAAVQLSLEQLADELEVPDGYTIVPEEADDHSYRDMVNAPLRPETIAAINKRLASGDYPVRKVPTRGSYPAKPGRATMAADRCPQCGGDNTEPWALCGNCETAGEQR